MKRHIEREKIRRLAKWANGKPQPPIRIDLEPTFGCNLKCKFCWQRDPYRIGQTNYTRALKEERLIQLVHEAAELDVVEWQIAGGWEPMIKPQMAMKLMKLIKHYGMFGCLTTNGTLFTEAMVKELVEIGWDQILFSLEGDNAKTHDNLTGIKGSFDKAVQAMEWFRDWKKKLKKKSPRFSFHTVITNKNYKQLTGLVNLGRKLEVEGIGFESLNIWSNECEKIKLSKKDTKEFIEHVRKAVKLARKYNLPTTLEKFLDERLIDKEKMDLVIHSDVEEIKNKVNKGKKEVDKVNNLNKKSKNYKDEFMTTSCYEPFTSLEIRASGHVVECRLCDFQDYAPRLQNKTLKEIWYGPYFTKMRNKMLKGNLPRYCKTCAAGIVVDMRHLREEMLKIKKNPLVKLKRKILR